jgi:hypothetical protein
MGQRFKHLAVKKIGTGLKKRSQLRQRITSAPGHENGDTAATCDATFGAVLTQPRNVPVFFSLFEKTKPIGRRLNIKLSKSCGPKIRTRCGEEDRRG